MRLWCCTICTVDLLTHIQPHIHTLASCKQHTMRYSQYPASCRCLTEKEFETLTHVRVRVRVMLEFETHVISLVKQTSKIRTNWQPQSSLSQTSAFCTWSPPNQPTSITGWLGGWTAEWFKSEIIKMLQLKPSSAWFSNAHPGLFYLIRWKDERWKRGRNIERTFCRDVDSKHSQFVCFFLKRWAGLQQGIRGN